MPAIRLRSDRNTLRSACDHPIDQPSIRLLSAAITLLFSPHTPGGSQAPLPASMASLAYAPKEEGSGKDPGTTNNVVTSNGIEPRSIVSLLIIILNWLVSISQPSRIVTGLVTVTAAADFAHTAPTRCGAWWTKPYNQAVSCDRPHDRWSRNRVALAFGPPVSQVEQRRNLAMGDIPQPEGENTRVGVGVPRNYAARSKIYLPSKFRGPLQKPCCRFATVTVCRFLGGGFPKNPGGQRTGAP
jgi:hypothetical protein